MFCKNCGAQVKDGASFCPKCGSRIAAAPVPNQMPTQNSYQGQNSGTDPVYAFVAAGNRSVNQTVVNQKPKKAKKSGAKVAIIVLVALFLVAAIGIGAFLIINNLPAKKSKAPFAYVSGDNLYVMKSLTEDSKPVCISRDYADYAFFSDDGKYILYGEKGSNYEDEYKVDLYYKEVFNEKDEGRLVAKGVSHVFTVDDSLTKLIYEKNGNVYFGETLGEIKKIASDVSIYDFNADTMLAVCSHYYRSYYDDYDEEYGGYYEVGLIDLNDDNPDYDMITDSCDDFVCSDDLTTLYFVENDSLYMSKRGESRDKISDDVVVNNVYSSPNGVYFTADGSEITFYDLVDDPYVESDKKIVKPEYRDYEVDREDYYETRYDEFFDEEYEYFDDEAYYEAVEKADEEYDEAYTKYLESMDRNQIRESFSSHILSYTQKVYYFDGSKSTLIFDDINSFYSMEKIGKGKKLAFRVNAFAKPVSEMKKTSIDNLYDEDEIRASFDDQVDFKTYVVIDGVSSELDTDDEIARAFYNSDSDEIYLFTYDTAAKTMSYDFYTLNAGAPFSEANLIQANCQGFIMANGKAYYCDSYDEDYYTCTVHIDGIGSIDDVNSVMSDSSDTAVYISTDYSDRTYESTVYRYKDGKKEKIGDDVFFRPWSFAVYDEKYVYITDVDSREYNGTLVCRDADKTFEIDSDVEYIVGGDMNYCGIYSAVSYDGY